MKKILLGYLTNCKGSGINKYIDTFVNSLNDEKIQIDFLTRDKEEDIKENINIAKNNNVLTISRNRRPIKQLIEMIKILKKGNYDITYFNISETFDCIGIIAAKICKIKKIIAHSHSSGEDSKNNIIRRMKELLNLICKPIIRKCCNSYLTCSKTAAKWLYTRDIIEDEEYSIIYNSVDSEKFKYNEEKREQIRKELNLTNKFIIGHVGRFCSQKNHKFILEIFKDVFAKKKDAVGVLIGEGEELETIKEYANKLEITDKIIFLNNRQNIQDYMSAFDVFILPSKFEGLPIVGVEAQFSGLPCLFSDTISDEIIISENAKQISIDDKETWVNSILKMKIRKNNLTDLSKNYDTTNNKKQFKNIIDIENIKKPINRNYKSHIAIKIILIIHYILNLTAYLNGFNYLLIIVAVLMGIVFIHEIKNYKNILKNKIYILYLLFIASYLFTFLLNYKGNIIGSIKILIWLGIQFFFVFGCYNVTTNKKVKIELKYIFTIYVLIVSIINLDNLFMLITHTSKIIESINTKQYIVGITNWGRFYGNYYDPNYSSVICICSIIFAMYLFKIYKTKIMKISLIISIIIQLTYVIMCQSRTGIVTLVVALDIYVIGNIYIKNIKKTKSIPIAILAFIIIGSSSYILPKFMINIYNKTMTQEKNEDESYVEVGRSDNQGDISNRRFDIWKSGGEIFKDNVFYGIGFAEIQNKAMRDYPNTYIINNDFQKFDAFHNSIIDVFVSQGIIGGIIMFAIYLYILIETVKNRKQIFKLENKETIPLISCGIAIMVSSMFLSEIFYVNNACTFTFWLLFGYYNYYLTKKA